MTHASLFSGIGGFDLAAEWMGWQNVFNCEIDPFCRKVLAYHFPNAKQYEDVKTTDFTIHRGHIDVLTGGFPCQPFSLAGKRKGSDDNRYLWPEMLRAIREIQPRWVVGENVFGIVNWSDGMVFEQVQSDLENEGYEVQPYIIPACAVDAPHRRDRVWFVAHRRDTGTEILQREGTISICESAVPTDTPCNGWGGRGLNKDVQSNGTSFYRENRRGVRFGVNLSDVLASGLLPTPDATEADHARKKWNPKSQRGRGLTAMAVKGMLPTPSARDWKGRTNPGIRKVGCGNIYGETLPDAIYRAFQNSQLNPLYVAEMMGFPTDWTLAPFLNGLKSINDGDSAAGGAENPSKPTVTP